MATKRAAKEAATATPPEPTPAAVVEPVYNVTIRLQQGLIGGDATVHFPNVPEARVWALLRDEVTFIRVPDYLNTHPQGETKFLNRDQILELHIFPAWPHSEPW